MTPVNLKRLDELMPQVERVVSRIFAQLGALFPTAELHHVGATAVAGSLTKGDVDVLLRVSGQSFPEVVAELRRHFAIQQPENWLPDFASFGDDKNYELPLGIQVVVKDSENDFLLYLRDYLITNAEALGEYNQLKRMHACKGPEAYWKAKDAFFSKILTSR